MQKAEIPQQSFNLNGNSQIHNSQLSANIHINLKKSRQRQLSYPHCSKQNESKHMNAIKPYVKDRQRKVSKRQSQKNLPVGSPYLQQSVITGLPTQSNSKNKGKKQTSLKKLGEDSVSCKNIGDLYTQLVTIKAEYKTLKNSYNGLIKQNNDLTERGSKQAAAVTQLKRELQKIRREQQKSRSNVRIMEQQIERIKKQCVRMIETEKFKNKKLQETLQQKQLMIAFLRSQLAVLNGQSGTTNSTGFFFQHTAPTYLKSTGIHNPINVQTNEINMEQWVAPETNENKSAIRGVASNINKSIINSSAISSIQNASAVGVSDIIDLPRQITLNKRKIDVHAENTYQPYIISSDSKNEQRLSIENKVKNKRQYIFSNEDDSLSFSYQKSKESIKDHEYDSSDPTVLTFTKKDVYVLEEEDDYLHKKQESFVKLESKHEKVKRKVELDNENPKMYQIGQILDKNRKKSIEKQSQIKSKGYTQKNSKRMDIDVEDQEQYDQVTQNDASQSQNIHIRQDASSYTGQQQILTFENRYAQKNRSDLINLLNPHQKQKKKSDYKQKNRGKQKAQQEKKQVSSKSKLLTKRLQINTDEVGGLAEGKESSAETKKRPTTHQINTSKTGKKKISRKRKSQEAGGSIIKK